MNFSRMNQSNVGPGKPLINKKYLKEQNDERKMKKKRQKKTKTKISKQKKTSDVVEEAKVGKLEKM